MARPNLSYLKNLLLVLTGIPCGLIAGCTGIGISVLLLPLLGYLLGARSLRFPGTIEVVSVVAAGAALVGYVQNGEVVWILAIVLLFSQILGAALAQRAGLSSRSHAELLRIGAVITILAGLAIAAAGRTHGMWAGGAHPGHLGTAAPFAPSPNLFWHAVLAGLLCGIISEAFDLGGLFLPMVAVFGLGIPASVAQGTALAALLPLYLMILPLRAHARLVEARPAAWLSLGALFGALCGGQLAAVSLPARILLILSGGVYCIVGLVRFLQTTPKK